MDEITTLQNVDPFRSPDIIAYAANLQQEFIEKRGDGYIVQVVGKTDVQMREAHLSQEAKRLIDAWLEAWPFSSLEQIPTFAVSKSNSVIGNLSHMR